MMLSVAVAKMEEVTVPVDEGVRSTVEVDEGDKDCDAVADIVSDDV